MHAQKRLSHLLFLAFGIPGAVFADAPNDGILDTSFANNGKISIAFDMGELDTDLASDAVADSQGRTYIVGTVATDAGTRIGITRLNADGSVDHGYGNHVNGFVGPSGAGFAVTGASAALDAQDHLLVGTTINIAGNNDFYLCRFASNGSPANFVGSNAKCVRHGLDLGTVKSDRLHDIAVQDDGKIVLVGSATAILDPFLIFGAIMRLDPDGTLDETFKFGGEQAVLPPDQQEVRFKAAAIQKLNGKIIVVGECKAEGANETDTCVARFTSDGTLDNTFSGDGFRNYFAIDGLGNGSFDGVALAPHVPGQLFFDQRIIAVGKLNTFPAQTTPYRGLIARIKIDGGLDSSFTDGNQNGYVLVESGSELRFTDVEVEPNRAITVGGTMTFPGPLDFFYVGRFLKNGAPDLTDFGAGNGFSGTNILVSPNQDQASAIAFHPSRIVVAGSTQRAAPGDTDFAAAAFQRDRIFQNGVQILD